MKNKNLFIVLILTVVCILIAVGAYLWASGMIDSNYAYRSPLKNIPPAPGLALGEPASGRLVIVLIDALRYDTSLKTGVMPTLAELRQQGASALMHSRPPSFSEPGYSTLLTGAWPDINDGPVFNLDYEYIPTFTQDNLFSASKRTGLSTAVSGYYWFEKLIPQADLDFSFYTPGEDAAADREVVDAALPWLENNQAQLVLIHIDQVDYAGHHEGGPASENWDAAAKRSDALLAEVLAELDLSEDTIVVLSDHGQIDSGGHGGQDAVVLVEPFVIAGNGVKPGTYPDINMVDVAPTLAALLGTNLPASAQGQVQSGMLNLSSSVINSLPDATKDQQSALLNAYAQSVNPNAKFISPESSDVNAYQAVIDKIRADRLFKERVWRSLVSALYLGILLTLLARQRSNGSVGWVLAGLIFAVLFNTRYALLDQKVYSLSSIIGEMDLILYVGITSLVCLVAAWLIISLSTKTFRNTPYHAVKNTFGLGLITVFILSLPVVFSFVLNGAVVTWTLPDYLTSYLALLGLIQMLIVAGFSPVLAGVSALIAWINRKNNRD